MSNTISAIQAAQTWAAFQKSGSAAGTGAFLETMMQAQMQGTSSVQSAFRPTAAAPAAEVMPAASTEEAAQIQALSLESMLQARYPGIHYHVFDASSSHWKTRNDYPHYLLYQDGDKAKETLENWQPQGENPFYGSINGQFMAPKEIKALGNVPPGSKAVVIHPKVQERMEQDPAYAQEIYARIEAWFEFDIARNEAIMPGSTWDMAQAVAIGEDGNICNACASSPGGELTYSESPSGRKESWWDLRMARHAEYMKRVVSDQIEHSMSVSQFAQASAAKGRLLAMIRDSSFRDALGSEISGIPTETILGLALGEIGASGIL